ncbi:MAG TPA: hypothetical protein VNS22_17510 [Geminicoccus sp.]|uniref:hypothetical protein n=1 Tax=Geminicoccus sp. TaxID=2024832 RepID=UPI002C629CFD|nr:hypothetical protein [Geminicoccus sp.]HWL70163.1 hypothetical protein [Geminicoccus sp.]
MAQKWRRTGPWRESVLTQALQDERDGKFQALVGQRILVGFTFKDRDGNVQDHAQHTGWIVAASPDGIEIEDDETGDVFSIPADLDNLTVPAPGRYRLKKSGRIVIDPDLYSTFDIYPAPEGCVADEDEIETQT